MMPRPRKPKLSLLGWMSFSLSVWLEVTRSMPMLGLAGRARVGRSSSPLTAAELFFVEAGAAPRLGEAGLGSARLELGSSFTWALVAVLAATLVFFLGEVELGPEAELSLSLASLFTDSVFFTVFFVFFSSGAGAAAEAPDIMASNSSSSGDSVD